MVRLVWNVVRGIRSHKTVGPIIDGIIPTIHLRYGLQSLDIFLHSHLHNPLLGNVSLRPYNVYPSVGQIQANDRGALEPICEAYKRIEQCVPFAVLQDKTVDQ